MKRHLYLLISLLIFGCTSNFNKEQLDNLILIYNKEIKNNLMLLEKRASNNPEKAYDKYKKATKINELFQELHLKNNDRKGNSNKINEEINEIREIYESLYLKQDTLIDLRFNHLIKSKVLDIETKVMLYELNSKLISFINESIDSDNYKFNKLKAFVIPKKTQLKVGETYQGQVIIAAFDTTRTPNFKYGNHLFYSENGIGLLNIAATSKGVKKSFGTIEWLVEDINEVVELPFEIYYEVK